MFVADRLFNRVYMFAAAAAAVYIAIIILTGPRTTIGQFYLIKPEFIPLIIISQVTVLALRAMRNRFLLSSIGISIKFWRHILIYLSALAVIVITPGGAGEVVRAQFIKKESGASIPTTAPLYFVERFLDMITVLAVMLVALAFFPLWEGYVVAGIILLVSVLFFVLARNKAVFDGFARFFGRFRLVQKYTSVFGEMHNSFSKFLNLRVAGKAWLMSLPAWFMEAVTVYLVFIALGIDFEFVQVSVVYFTSLGAGVLSVIPGGLVVTEGSMIGLLRREGIVLSTAVAVALLVRISTLWLTTIIGIISSRLLMASYKD
jgi:glycosyltransferase 2 family protein